METVLPESEGIQQEKQRRVAWSSDALKIAIMYVLEHEGPATVAQLHERIGAQRANVTWCVRSLKDFGKIETDGGLAKVWRIAK